LHSSLKLEMDRLAAALIVRFRLLVFPFTSHRAMHPT
jgi:hypothetical protein